MTDLSNGFVFPGIRTRVLFGSGTLACVGEEVERLGCGHALVLSTPHQQAEAEALAAQLGPMACGTFCEAAMHTPTDVTERALLAYEHLSADCVVALGGGSTIGLGKAIATRTGADQIAVPTTYAGSEMTDILGETQDGRKVTRRDASIRPETVIYDVALTASLPRELTVTSALNAIAHAAEALYAPDRNPVVSLMAAEAIRAFKEGLPLVLEAPDDPAARAAVLYGAWLCSTALGYVSMSLHHKLAHTLGGSFGTPHADTHAILLPHTIGFNAEAVPDLLKPIVDALGDTPGAGLWDFARRLGAPMRLRDLGLSEDDMAKAATIALEKPYDNPRPFDRDAIHALLRAAWAGDRPQY